MTCPFEPLLSAYLDRSLGASEQSDVSRHLAHCPPCAAEASGLLHVKEALRSQPMPGMPFDLLATIESATLQKPRWWEADLFESRWAPAVAGLAAALGAWLFFHTSAAAPRATSAPIPVAQAPALPAHYQRPDHPRVALHHTEDEPPAANDLQ